MSDPLKPIAAIVRSEVDVDTLLRDAKAFGRQSLEAAIKCGELLLQAKAICPHGQWMPKLAKIGYSNSTSLRLMNTAKEHGKFANLANLTGTADESAPAQPTVGQTTYAKPIIYCRPCRVSKTGPNPKCKVCVAIRNAQPKLFEPEQPAVPETPAPTGDAAEEVPDTTLKDAEGLVLPERVRPYLEDRSIDEWVSKHGRPAFDALKELQTRPGACHVDLPLLQKKQSAIARQLKSAKLSHRCPECAGEGCTKCANSGLVSKALWSER